MSEQVDRHIDGSPLTEEEKKRYSVSMKIDVVEDFPRDEAHRYRLYRLCIDEACGGTGKIDGERCWACRGEGRIRDCITAVESPEALGVALVTLGREHEFDDCPTGCLDVFGAPGERWLWRPWRSSPRNVSDAGRVLASGRKTT